MYMEDICTNLFCLKKNHLLILCYPSTTTMLSSQVWSYKVSSSHLKVSHSVLFLLIAQPASHLSLLSLSHNLKLSNFNYALSQLSTCSYLFKIFLDDSRFQSLRMSFRNILPCIQNTLVIITSNIPLINHVLTFFPCFLHVYSYSDPLFLYSCRMPSMIMQQVLNEIWQNEFVRVYYLVI